MRWSAVITAGGIPPPSLAASMGVGHKALALVAGETCISRVVSSVIGSGVSEVAVVGEEAVCLHLPQGVMQVAPRENPAASAKAGLEQLHNPQNVLFIPADTPLITADHILDFIRKCESRISEESWLSIGLCRRSEFQATGAPHKPLKIKNYPCVSTSLMAGSAAGFAAATAQLDRASQNRKSQLRMALSAGPINLIRFITGMLTITKAEAIASKIMGGQALLILDCHAHTAMDIDDVADWKHLQDYVKRLGLE